MRYLIAALALSAAVLGGEADADENAAAERARIANERIQADLAARAKAEEERQRNAMRPAASVVVAPASAESAPVLPAEAVLAPATPPANPAGQPPAAPTAATAVESPPAPAARPAPPRDPAATSAALAQIQKLGELRDAGYVTEAEFERIKSRILSENF